MFVLCVCSEVVNSKNEHSEKKFEHVLKSGKSDFVFEFIEEARNFGCDFIVAKNPG